MMAASEFRFVLFRKYGYVLTSGRIEDKQNVLLIDAQVKINHPIRESLMFCEQFDLDGVLYVISVPKQLPL
jgi:hypothetical protein